MSNNILNGDLNTLENIIVDVNTYSLSARRHEEILDEIEEALREKHYLTELMPYEEM